jgi:hypothetical protein
MQIPFCLFDKTEPCSPRSAILQVSGSRTPWIGDWPVRRALHRTPPTQKQYAPGRIWTQCTSHRDDWLTCNLLDTYSRACRFEYGQGYWMSWPRGSMASPRPHGHFRIVPLFAHDRLFPFNWICSLVMTKTKPRGLSPRANYTDLCGLVVRVPGYRTEMYWDSCEVWTEFICHVEKSRLPLWSSG